MRALDLVGQRFGRLLVSERAESRKGRAMWRCACDCGAAVVVAGNDLVRRQRSCGCERNHGLRDRPEYMVWAAMLQRCDNPRCPAFQHYGGRGIKVCERWRDVRHFMADMGPRPEGGTLERIDNNGNYEPGNCRWATMAEQRRNTRKLTNLTYDGRTMLLTDWAATLGLSTSALCIRIQRWGVERALSTPVYANFRRY